MPVTYDYRCTSKKCGHEFEIFHRCTQEEAAKTRVLCPECGEDCTRLMGTGCGVHFKGSGFHCTDYKKPAHKSSADYILEADGQVQPHRKDQHPDGYRWS
jgi:putative FmdB family regulatory protein